MNRRSFIKVASALASGLIVPAEVGAFLAPRKTQLIVPGKLVYARFHVELVELTHKHVDGVLVQSSKTFKKEEVTFPVKDRGNLSDYAVSYATNWQIKIAEDSPSPLSYPSVDFYRVRDIDGMDLMIVSRDIARETRYRYGR